MNIISIIDIISFIAVLISLIIIIFKGKQILTKPTKILFGSILFLTLLHDFSNILEWSGITKSLDIFEDYIEILHPFMWIFFFYIFIQERINGQLKENEEKYRMLAEQSGQIMYDYDILTGKIRWSGDIFSITGYTVKEFQEIDISNWEKLIHAADRESALSLLGEAMKKCSEYKVEYRFKHKDGKYLYVEDNGIFRVNENGKANKMFGLMKDISDRKQAQKALQESSKKWETTFNAMQDLVFLLDNDGNILKCNKSAERFFKKTSEQIIGNYCYKILHNTSGPIEGCPIMQMKKTLKRESMIFQVDHKWFNVGVEPIFDSNKELKGAVHVIMDITESKQAEEELTKYREHLEELVKERTKELEEKNKKLEEFNELFVDREFRIKELKDKVKELSE